MYLLIFMAVILSAAVNGQVPNNFIEDEQILTICIETNLEDLKKLRGSEFVHTFAVFAARELVGKVNVNATVIENIIESSINEPHDFPSSSSSDFWNRELQSALRNALVHCVYDKTCLYTSSRGKIPNDKDSRTDPKYFRLLNLLLVNWEIPPIVMATTPEGFRILAGYSDNLASTLHYAYALTNDTNELRLRIRNAWDWRVRKETNQLMRKKCPLFIYRYFLQDGLVYTCSCAEESINYDRWVTTEELTNVLRLFQSHPQNGRDDDVYNYMHGRMRNYELFFERRAIVNYRIAFFFFELRVRGLFTDQTVINQSFIDELPGDLLEILNNDDAYITYLANLREFFLGVVKLDNHLEEDMILYLYAEADERDPRPGKYMGGLSSSYTKGLYVKNLVQKMPNDVAISGQVANFTKDKESLILCIESNLEDLKRLRGAEFVQSFAIFAATELTGKSANETVIENIIKAFKHKSNDFPSTSTDKFWNKELEYALRNALIHCVKDKTCLYCVNRGKIPKNKDELTNTKYIRMMELALSSWPIPPRIMVMTSPRFISLAGYSDKLARAIDRAYGLTRDTNELRIRIRNAWEWRVNMETNDRSTRCPLFIYRYSNRNGSVYTCGCAEDSGNYEQKVTAEYILSVLRLFQSHSQSEGDDDLYFNYEHDGMSNYELYYERRSISNYRIMFFFLELRVRGILTDQTVINQAFIDALPEDLLAILDDDEAYITYITNLRQFLVEAVHLENPMEEDTILYLYGEADEMNPRRRYFGGLSSRYRRGLYAKYVSEKFYNATGASNSSTINRLSTSTIRPTSKRPFYKRMKNKMYKYFKGKHLGHYNYDSLPEACYEDDFEGSDSGAFGSNDKAHLKKTGNYKKCYGYTVRNGLYPDENEAMFLNKGFRLFVSSEVCSRLV